MAVSCRLNQQRIATKLYYWLTNTFCVRCLDVSYSIIHDAVYHKPMEAQVEFGTLRYKREQQYE